jgi:hypothetical protein
MLGVNRHAMWMFELAVALSYAAPFADKSHTVGLGKYLHPVVGIIAHVHMLSVNRHADWMFELAIALSLASCPICRQKYRQPWKRPASGGY